MSGVNESRGLFAGSGPRRSPAVRFVIAYTALALLGVTGCDPLQTTDPTVVTPDGLQGPSSVSAVRAGVVGDFQDAFDNTVMSSGIFTDEFLLSGSGSQELDNRTPEQGSRADDSFEELQISRQSAQNAIQRFNESLGAPEFAEVENELEEGLALANLYGAYDRVLFAELFCRSILEPNGAPISPDATMESALSMFATAESRAQQAGRNDLVTTARVGMARANLWLGNYSEAASLVSGVSTTFVFLANYSSNSEVQRNFVMAQTNGLEPAGFRRFSIGDGTASKRDNETYAYFDEWVQQGLIDPTPGVAAMDPSIPLRLQVLYSNLGADIVLASGWEARMIEVEAMLRGGQVQAAEDLANDLLTDPDQGRNPMTRVNTDLTLGAFAAVDFTGDLQNDLPQVARARAAGLWLTGERTGTFRRYLEDGVDLFPDRNGSATCWPIPQDEIQNNPNL